MQLQLADVSGAPVANTAFWVTLTVAKEGDRITIYFPTLNFQVGQCAANDPDCTPTMPGYLITTAGYLPPEWRPNTLVPVSVVASAGDGLAQTFATTPPTPPSGYIVLIDNAGEVIIQQAGSSQNAIAVGPHIVLPCSISYTAGKKEEICFNFQISEGEIDLTQFTGINPHTTPRGDNIRDSHLNDAFEDTFAWGWTDNHNLDYASNTLNVFVAVGKINSKGKMKLGKPVQVTNFPPNMIAWDTSIAINRQNKNNLVVSYGLIQYDSSGMSVIQLKNCRAVSFDGGKTWGGVFDGTNTLTYNGAINYQTLTGFGDIPGVRADQYGNFWFGSTDRSGGTNTPYLLLSQDSGVTWSDPPVYQFFAITSPEKYDYPHLVFGQNGTGQYGVWYYTDYITAAGNIYPAVAFLPIAGLGSYGTATYFYLSVFPNSIETPSITASMDGRFWALGRSFSSSFFYNFPLVSLFKSAGTLDVNYAGPWLLGSQNQLQIISDQLFEFSSVPLFGYFYTVQELLYDDSRQALYAIFSANFPTLSQNMRLYFSISRNNGLTWSQPYDISTTAIANRGFSSMALDQGNLYLGWYDGRNDPNFQKIQYFGGIIPAQKLDRLVNQIPLSYPTFSIPGQGSTMLPTP